MLLLEINNRAILSDHSRKLCLIDNNRIRTLQISILIFLSGKEKEGISVTQFRAMFQILNLIHIETRCSK